MTAPYTEPDVWSALDAGDITPAEARNRILHLDGLRVAGQVLGGTAREARDLAPLPPPAPTATEPGLMVGPGGISRITEPTPAAAPAGERLPTIREHLAELRAAGKPARLGSPTGADTVMPTEQAAAMDRASSLPAVVGRALAKNPVLQGAADVAATAGPVLQAGGQALAPMGGAFPAAEKVGQGIEDLNAKRLAAEQEAAAAAPPEPGPIALARGLTRAAVAYTPLMAGVEAAIPAAVAPMGASALARGAIAAVRAARSGVAMGGAGAALEAGAGGTPPEVATRAVRDFLLGTGFGAAGELVGAAKGAAGPILERVRARRAAPEAPALTLENTRNVPTPFDEHGNPAPRQFTTLDGRPLTPAETAQIRALSNAREAESRALVADRRARVREDAPPDRRAGAQPIAAAGAPPVPARAAPEPVPPPEVVAPAGRSAVEPPPQGPPAVEPPALPGGDISPPAGGRIPEAPPEAVAPPGVPAIVPDRWVGVERGRVAMTQDFANADGALNAYTTELQAKYPPMSGVDALTAPERAKLDGLQATRDAALEANRSAFQAPEAPVVPAEPVAQTPAAESPARLSIRKSTYRDRSGFSISGRDARGRSVNIFAETRAAAEHIREKVKAGEDVASADFAVGGPVAASDFAKVAQPAGVVNPAVVSALTTGGIGAAAGAVAGARGNEDHPVRGAILGGLAGGLVGGGLGAYAEGAFRRAKPGELSAAERTVLGHVGRAEPEMPSFRETIGRLYARNVRRTYPIEKAAARLGEGRTPVHQNAGDWAMLASGSAVRAEEFLAGRGGFQWTTEGGITFTGTPSFRTILKAVAHERGGVSAFQAYEVSAHALELEARGIKTGVDLAAAAQTVADASPGVKWAAAKVVRLRREARDYWAAEGGVSPEGVKAMDALSEHYVPFYRVFEGAEKTGGVGRPGQVGQQIKSQVGSVRKIKDTILTTEDQISRMIEAGDRNRVVRTLVEAAEQNPVAAMGLLEREIGPVGKAASQYARRLQAEAKVRGVELTDAVATELAQSLAGKELVGAGNRVTTWRNGKLEAWRVDPELGRALNSLGPYQAGLFVRLAGLSARTLKAGITLDPAFGAFNAFRDAFDATVQSRYGFRLVPPSFEGFYHALMKTPEYHELRAGGMGFSNTLRGRARSRGALERLVLPMSTGQRIVSRLLHPGEALADFGRPFEEAARIGEALRGRRAGGSVAAQVRAGQEVTTNFQQIGQETQGLMHMTAFLNPAVQSLDRAVRVAGGEAYGVARSQGLGRAAAARAGGQDAARILVKGAAVIGLPSVYFWLAARGDQEIQDLRKTNAGLIYWFLRDPSGQIRHLPKPFLWGQVFGTSVESALDKLADQDPEAVGRLETGLWDQIQSNVVPTLAQQAIAQYANKTPFFGTPIVPPEQLGTVEPRYQGSVHTGPFARAVAEKIGRTGEALGNETLSRSVSPARLEALVRGVGGRLGGYGLQLADWLTRPAGEGEPPAGAAADLMVLGRLSARTPSTGVEPVQTFYRDARRSAEAAGTLKKIEGEGDAGAADRFIGRHENALEQGDLYQSAMKELRSLRAEQDDIRRDPSLSGAEKRRKIDELTRAIVETTREANAMARESTAPAPRGIRAALAARSAVSAP